ncbi:MAG: superoxide dismutase family protein [Propionibacteriaceae bacterium]|nr:superoxide dismutase family protein [Propionibacteriaceae bacterium]
MTPNRKTRLASVALLGAVSLIGLSACGNGETATTPPPTPDGGATAAPNGATAAPNGTTADPGGADAAATATLQNAEGAEVGTVTFTETDGALQIEATVQDLEAGFYGFHIHGIGVCEPDSAAPNNPENTGDFLSAGGHLGADAGDHPEHQGDLPSLLVMDDGEGRLLFTTDRVTMDDLTDDDGAAMMVHGDPDNFANIPERYAAEGADDDTLGTGDAGSRLACGVIEAAE